MHNAFNYQKFFKLEDVTNILLGVKRGERSAQNKLYQMFKNYWFSICLRYNSREDASDALQNALIKIFKNINQFNSDKGSFKSWASKIVVNENLMIIRKKKQLSESDDVVEEMHLISNNHNAIDELNAEELVKLVQQLPAGYRTVFNLYVFEEKSHNEIAELLQIKTGTSKSQLSKARKYLQVELEKLMLIPNHYEA